MSQFLPCPTPGNNSIQTSWLLEWWGNFIFFSYEKVQIPYLKVFCWLFFYSTCIYAWRNHLPAQSFQNLRIQCKLMRIDEIWWDIELIRGSTCLFVRSIPGQLDTKQKTLLKLPTNYKQISLANTPFPLSYLIYMDRDLLLCIILVL